MFGWKKKKQSFQLPRPKRKGELRTLTMKMAAENKTETENSGVSVICEIVYRASDEYL